MNNGGGYYPCYIRSTNGGDTWGNSIVLHNEIPQNHNDAAITVSYPIIHVIYRDPANIFYIQSTNNGLLWGSSVTITSTFSNKFNPVISSIGQDVFVFWDDIRHGNKQIYFLQSTNNGLVWSNEIRFTNNTGDSEYPSISINDPYIHLVFQSNHQGNPEIYCKSSSDRGTTWGPENRLTNNTDWSHKPKICTQGSLLHITWIDYRVNFQPQIFYKRSTDNGFSWGNDFQITSNFDTVISNNPFINSSGLNIHIVWEDNRFINDEIFYKRSTDNGQSWGNDIRLTNSQGYSRRALVTSISSSVNVFFLDNRVAPPQVYYKKNPTGNAIGIKLISSEIPVSFSLSQNYPNPFNPVTKIKFNISKVGQTFLSVYDIQGKDIATLVNEQLQPGTYEVDFNGGNLASGVYFYKLVTDDYTETKQMVLLK